MRVSGLIPHGSHTPQAAFCAEMQSVTCFRGMRRVCFCFYERGSKMSASGSKLLRTDLSNVPVRLAICRCLPVSGWPRLDCAANTERRQAGFLTTVRRGLKTCLVGTWEIFLGLPGGLLDICELIACPAALSGSGIENPLAQFVGPCFARSDGELQEGVTERRGDCSGLATMQLLLVCMHTRFCGAGIATGPHASEQDLFFFFFFCTESLQKYLQSRQNDVLCNQFLPLQTQSVMMMRYRSDSALRRSDTTI